MKSKLSVIQNPAGDYYKVYEVTRRECVTHQARAGEHTTRYEVVRTDITVPVTVFEDRDEAHAYADERNLGVDDLRLGIANRYLAEYGLRIDRKAPAYYQVVETALVHGSGIYAPCPSLDEALKVAGRVTGNR